MSNLSNGTHARDKEVQYIVITKVSKNFMCSLFYMFVNLFDLRFQKTEFFEFCQKRTERLKVPKSPKTNTAVLLSWWCAGLVFERLRNPGSIPYTVACRCILAAKQSTRRGPALQKKFNLVYLFID